MFAAGRVFIDWYYGYSPPLAKYMEPRPVLRAIVRALLVAVLFAIDYPIAVFLAEHTVQSPTGAGETNARFLEKLQQQLNSASQGFLKISQTLGSIAIYSRLCNSLAIVLRHHPETRLEWGGRGPRPASILQQHPRTCRLR
jgi:hypothetical protein